ncbi:hypothetical protein O6H91_17G076400 [Diphasiastrum complanatum]|nr:hypothetical protein O6H91_17G076400 [Diphasiastrum complanatum]KAJ7525967.1 hypothetical protein O6H91_17G076400 [Diphasiastrum complanatum]KAJ7525968.1 hypothetical protein O6H91_17G076400 [Diphasiastrum complanatum]KAJ7525969.1 hypothetical protein O6H91_17G076400 [Diphasiastrum complanatum]KAJ7525970.1 hypothetical protein O6H91_17G076400 [Diphasiastrum complanatum]
MMQGGTQSREVGEEGSSTASNISKFSLLGQHLTHFCPPNHQLIPSGHLGFSLGANQPPPSYCFPPPSLPYPHFQPQSHGGNAVLPNTFQVYPLAAAQNFNLQICSEMAAAQDANGRDMLKPGPPGTPPVAGPPISPSIISAVAVLQQKVSQLHSLIQLIFDGGQGNASLCQQHATVAAGVATFISQLALTTAGMLQFSQQQQPLVPYSGQTFPDAQLSHMFGMPVPPGLHLLQTNRSVGQNVSSALGESSGGTLGGPLASLATSTEDCNRLVEKPISRVGSAYYSNHHLPSQENLQCTVEARRNTVASSMDADVTITTFGEGGEILSGSGAAQAAGKANVTSEDLDSGGGSRDEEDDGEAEHLSPGSYELVEMDAIEILAEHTHFCEICGKGFKRDANLRMHMRGHGDEYKTPAALARPERSQDPLGLKPRRYSCPFSGCKRNKNHRKFLPLKTMLCVKNHYRRSHCPKLLTCSKCQSKKFSVVADLKTHEKHCGCDKWQCSCGTTFSRKDKLFGHIGLFQGHMPAFPLHEMNASAVGAATDVAINEADCLAGRRAIEGSEIDSDYRIGGEFSNEVDMVQETNLGSEGDASLGMVGIVGTAAVGGIVQGLESKENRSHISLVGGMNGSLSGSGAPSCRNFSQSGKDVEGLHGLL